MYTCIRVRLREYLEAYRAIEEARGHLVEVMIALE